MRTSSILGAMLLSAACASTALASDPKAPAAPLTDTTCWDFASQHPADRGLLLMLYYGIHLGSHQVTSLSADDVEPTLRSVADLCRQEPDLSLIDAFAKVGYAR